MASRRQVAQRDSFWLPGVKIPSLSTRQRSSIALIRQAVDYRSILLNALAPQASTIQLGLS